MGTGNARMILLAVWPRNSRRNGTLFSTQPLWHEGVHLDLVITGATIVAFSFIGFDAITMHTEEAKNSSTVPKAILLALFIGGAIFFVAAFFTQSLFPDVSNISQESLENSALPEIAFNVGGHLFKILLTSAAFAATVASSLASHASVSRLLYVMGATAAARSADSSAISTRLSKPRRTRSSSWVWSRCWRSRSTSTSSPR